MFLREQNSVKLTDSFRRWMKNCFRLNDILTIFDLQHQGKTTLTK